MFGVVRFAIQAEPAEGRLGSEIDTEGVEREYTGYSNLSI